VEVTPTPIVVQTYRIFSVARRLVFMWERLLYRHCTMRNFCRISNNRSGVAFISTDIFRAVPILQTCLSVN